MKKIFKIKSEVWRWPGDIGWHFINLDKELSEKIKNIQNKGMVRITAKVGKTSWDTSLFPHKESKSYLLCVKKSVRKKEDIWAGDMVKISFVLL